MLRVPVRTIICIIQYEVRVPYLYWLYARYDDDDFVGILLHDACMHAFMMMMMCLMCYFFFPSFIHSFIHPPTGTTRLRVHYDCCPGVLSYYCALRTVVYLSSFTAAPTSSSRTRRSSIGSHRDVLLLMVMASTKVSSVQVVIGTTKAASSSTYSYRYYRSKRRSSSQLILLLLMMMILSVQQQVSILLLLSSNYYYYCLPGAEAFAAPRSMGRPATTSTSTTTSSRSPLRQRNTYHRRPDYTTTTTTTTSTTTSTATTTQLQVSSIRTWFSLVKNNNNNNKTPASRDNSSSSSSSSKQGEDDSSLSSSSLAQQQRRKPSIFFKRNHHRRHEKNNSSNNNNKTQSPLQDETLMIPSSSNLSSSNLLLAAGMDHSNTTTGGGNPETTTTTTWVNLLVGEQDNNSSNNKNNNNNATTSSETSSNKRYGIFAPFPEYTSAWANTLSSTLHNTTSNAWNTMVHSPHSNSSSSSGGTGFVIGSGSGTTGDQHHHHNPSSSLQQPPLSTILAIPPYLQPTDTLTVADLQAILQRNGYNMGDDSSSPSSSSSSSSSTPSSRRQVRASDFASTSSSTLSGSSSQKSLQDTLIPPSQALAAPVTSSSSSGTISSSSSSSSTTKPRKTKQGVAFPQVSVLDYKSLQRGTAVASAMVGMLVATTLLPNLWLMGLIAGAVYGNDICSRPDEPPPSHLLARTLIGWGRRLAQFTLQTMDSCRTLWFLYKTGELSYQYYKSYEKMDQRFAIQSKMDAWNARFQEGKRQFDQWERDNEIGRTVLAGLRTAWLVDERAKRRAKQKSRYRLVQSLYDTKYWMGRWTRKTWKAVQTSQWTESVRDYIQGIRTDLWNSRDGGSWGTRLGAVVASLITVNIVGALFAISPTFLALLAIGVGIAWPSWVPELVSRLNVLTLETRARGRGEDTSEFTLPTLLLSNNNNNSNSRTNTARLLGRYDKSKYHYFKREDGSKRFYRTGQSLFGGRDKNQKKIVIANTSSQIKKTTSGTGGKNKSGSVSSSVSSLSVSSSSSHGSTTFSWPWAKPQRVRRTPEKEQWGLFFQKAKKN